VFTAARYAVEGSIPSARAKHSSQKLRGRCVAKNAATRSLAIIVTHLKEWDRRERAEITKRSDARDVRTRRPVVKSDARCRFSGTGHILHSRSRGRDFQILKRQT